MYANVLPEVLMVVLKSNLNGHEKVFKSLKFKVETCKY